MEISPRFSAQNLLDFLSEQRISYTLYTHEPVFTVEESHKVDKGIPGTHTRNMFLRDKKERMFLVTLRHDTPIDLKKLSDLLGTGRFSFGSPERLWTYLGVRPGSVTPLSILNDSEHKVSIILEKQMMETDLVNFHPLDNSMTVGMHPSELMTILEKEGITPQIIDLSPAESDKE